MAGGNLNDRGFHVALLRGINVGGKNKLPMKQLVSMFEAAGCVAVRSYIQSGNVAFQAEPELAGQVPEIIRQQIAEQLGFQIPIVTRTAAEVATIVRANPFLGPDVDEKTLHVAYLADQPGAAEIAALDRDRSPSDEYRVLGREIYLHCPKGLARTKLTNAYFDSKLATTSTIRNWRTTLKLLEMTAVS
ncbi:MAG: DUF1697 domain-containing protein [Acidobacteriota bacterium]